MNNYDESWDRPSDDWDYPEDKSIVPEFAVGQIWRIVGGFLYEQALCNKCLVEVTSVQTDFASDQAIMTCLVSDSKYSVYDFDRIAGDIEYVAQGPVKSSEDVSPAYATSVPEEVESVSQAITGSFKETSKDMPGEFMWKLIDGSQNYNGHKQLEISQMSLAELKLVVRTLEQYLEHDEDTLATCLEIRLMYNGDHFGNWGASVYQVGFWKEQEHPLGHRDRLLFTVEELTNVS